MPEAVEAYSIPMPEAVEAHARKKLVKREHLALVHATPRFLQVNVRAPFAQLDVVVAHAQNQWGSDEEKVLAWWRWFGDTLRSRPRPHGQPPDQVLVALKVLVGDPCPAGTVHPRPPSAR